MTAVRIRGGGGAEMLFPASREARWLGPDRGVEL
jgi:hypothetical protein